MNVKPANHRIAICRVRTRPMRSANHPASHPPNAETISAAVPSSPACPRVMPQVAISAGNHKAVELHVHRVQRPPADARPQRAPLRRGQIRDPAELAPDFTATPAASITSFITRAL
jgi:hypothetical protein